MTHLERRGALQPVELCSPRRHPSSNTANRAGTLHRCSVKPRNPASRSAIRVLSRKEQVLRFQPRSERVDGVQLLFAVSGSSQPAYHIVAVKPLPALVFTRIDDRIVDRDNCPGRFGKRMNVPSWFSTNSQGGMDKKIVRHKLKITHPCKGSGNPIFVEEPDITDMVAGRFRPGAEQVFPDARLAVYSTWAEQRSRRRPQEPP